MHRNEGRTVANRRAGVLSEKLESRIATYVAGAGAAGVGLLALVQLTEAQVVYTPAHVVIKPGTTYDLDLNNDGHTDFMFADQFLARTSVGSFFVSPFASNQGLDGNGVEIKNSQIFFPAALNRGARIGASQIFYGRASVALAPPSLWHGPIPSQITVTGSTSKTASWD